MGNVSIRDKIFDMSIFVDNFANFEKVVYFPWTKIGVSLIICIVCAIIKAIVKL